MASKSFVSLFLVGLIASNAILEVASFGGLFGGGHGDNGLAEILAAGLVTKLLMEGFGGAGGQGGSLLESIERFAFSSARGIHEYSMGQSMPQQMMKMPFNPIMENSQYHPTEMQLHSRFFFPSAQESLQHNGMMISEAGMHPILAAVRYHGFPYEPMSSPSLDLLSLSDSVMNGGSALPPFLLGSEEGIPSSMGMPNTDMFEARADEQREKLFLPGIVRHFVDRIVQGREQRT